MTGGSGTSAIETAAAVRRGERSAADTVAAALARIGEVNPSLNAFCEVRGRAALERATEIDAAVARGEDPGPLAGVPVAIKDSIWEAGVEATNGSRARLGFVPERSAVVVERLESAGAIVVGRTNLPEFCYRGDCANDLYGATGNPWDPERTPGGSSGGSAAAVAAGICPIAIGSDGGGSIRIPASFCGIVGHKATYGLVPRAPGWPGWFSLNHVGPLAATVADCALALQVLAGPDPLDPASLPPLGADLAAAGAGGRADLVGLRIAVSPDLGYVALDESVRAAFQAAVERFAALGAELVDAHPAVASPLATWETLAFADNVASEGDARATGRVGPDAAALIALGDGISGAAYARARNAQADYAATWHAFLLDYDLLLTPTMECTAFPLGRSSPATIGGRPVEGPGDDWCHLTYPFDLTGQPAVSVPMGLVDGLPAGLQIIGRRFEDATVLRAAAAWEGIAPFPSPSPVRTPAPPPTEVDAEAIRAARRRGEGSATVQTPGRLVAGASIDGPDGPILVRRVLSPRDGERRAEF